MTKNKQMEKSEKNEKSLVLLTILIILFCLTFYITAQNVIKYYINQKELEKNNEVIKISNKKSNVTIVNSGDIKETISKNSFNNNDEYVVEKINYIEAIGNNKEDSTFKINLKYNILENEFQNNMIATNKSEVLVRFSYSYDNDNWTYLNNVISTNSSNISPLIGNYYDIAGLITNLNIVTNYEIEISSEKKEKVYWRSETIFKKINDEDEDKKFKANFTIEYQGNN